MSDPAALCQGVNVTTTECPEPAAGITFPARCLCWLQGPGSLRLSPVRAVSSILFVPLPVFLFPAGSLPPRQAPFRVPSPRTRTLGACALDPRPSSPRAEALQSPSCPELLVTTTGSRASERLCCGAWPPWGSVFIIICPMVVPAGGCRDLRSLSPALTPRQAWGGGLGRGAGARAEPPPHLQWSDLAASRASSALF